MIRRMICALALITACHATSAAAQTIATSTSTLAWSQQAPDLATVQSYVFPAYVDGAGTGTPLTSVACSGAASPFSCVAPLPTVATGTHTLALSAKSAAGESAKGLVLTFSFVVVPPAPTNLRIQPPGARP